MKTDGDTLIEYITRNMCTFPLCFVLLWVGTDRFTYIFQDYFTLHKYYVQSIIFSITVNSFFLLQLTRKDMVSSNVAFHDLAVTCIDKLGHLFTLRAAFHAYIPRCIHISPLKHAFAEQSVSIHISAKSYKFVRARKESLAVKCNIMKQ